jgi:predicted HTH domain antitoxin
MKTIAIEIPDEIINLLGSEEEAVKEAKEALVLDLVRRGKVSKAKAAELVGISLWELPDLLAKYRIPWFDYSKEELQRDIDRLKEIKRL